MPRSVTLPDGSIFPNVPDHVSDEMAIKEAVRRGYIAPPEGALGSFAKNLAGSSLSGIAGLMATGEELMGRNKASDITRGLQDYAKTFQAGPDVSEVAERALHGDLSGIKYALPAIAGQAIPTLASFMFPAGVVSKVAGAAKLSAGATKALQSATALGVGTQAAEGQSILERAEKGLPMDPSHTLAPSVGQGALDAFALSKVLGLGSKVAPTGLLRRAGETAVAEGLTEPVQSMLGHYAALSDTASPEEIAKALASPEARKGYLGDILAGGLGGGVLGGVGHFTGAHSAELANVNMLAQQALARPRWEDTAPKEREAFAIFNGLNPKEETGVATEWARQRNEFKTKNLTENASDEKLTGTATEEAENKKNVLEEANAVTPEITPSRPTQPAEFAPAEDPNMLPDEVLLEAWSDPESRAALTPYQRRRALDLVVARGETARSNEKKPWESYLLDTLKARAAQQIATEEAGSKQSNIAGIANILHQISQGQLTTPNIPAEQLLGMPAAETAQPMSAEDVTKLQRIADVSGLLQQVAQKNAPSPEQLLGMPAEKTAQPMSAEDVTKLQRIADVSGLLQQITQKNAPSPEQLLGMPAEKTAQPMSAEDVTKLQRIADVSGLLQQITQKNAPSPEQLLGMPPAESQVPLNSIEASAQQASMRKLLTDQGIVYAGAPDAASLGTTTGAQPGTTITDEDMARAAKLYAAQAEVPMVTPEVIAAAGIPKSLSPKLNKALDENNGRIPLGHPVIKNLIPKHQESLRKALENFQPAPAQAAEVSPNLPVDQAAEIPEVPNQPALTEGVPDASQIQSAVAADASRSTQPIDSQVLGNAQESGAGVSPVVTKGQEVAGKGVETQPISLPTKVGAPVFNKPYTYQGLKRIEVEIPITSHLGEAVPSQDYPTLKMYVPKGGNTWNIETPLGEVVAQGKTLKDAKAIVQRVADNVQYSPKLAVPYALRPDNGQPVLLRKPYLNNVENTVKKLKAELKQAPVEGVKYARSQKQTETPEFKKWFGDSKAVDTEGKPLVLYHGTGENFNAFEDREGRNGFYFTDNAGFANLFAEGKAPNIVPVHLSVKNPADLRKSIPSKLLRELRNAGYDRVDDLQSSAPTDRWEFFDGDTSLKKALTSLGYDGVRLDEPDPRNGEHNTTSWLVFYPNQIKSATGNIGTFDSENPDIRYAKSSTKNLISDVATPRSNETVDSLYQHAKKAFGKHTAKLMDAGRIRLVKDGSEAARLLGRAIPENVTAITDNNGIAYFIADRIQKHELPGLILHEVGTHVGLRDMVGDAVYRELLRQAQAGKGEAFDKARKAAETYPEHERAEETLAYIAQNAPNTPLVRKLIAHVKNWLFKTFPNLKLKLNEHDLRVMAVAAVKHAGKGVPMHINRQSPAFAKAQVPSAKAAKEFTKDLTYNSGGTIRRAVLSLQSLDQVLDIPRIQDSANALLAPMRRVSGMQHAMRLDSDKLERRIADVVQRDYESNARLGDFATLATLTNYFPSDQPMSAADVAKQTKDMTKEEATTYEKDVRELEKQWASMGKTARGKEMREVLKDTFAQNRKNLDAFNEAMKLRFANNPGMLKLYDEFYQQVKNKVYFPIMRFGDFVVNSFDVNGNPAFYRFDSEAEARRFAEQEMKKHPGKLIDFGAARDRDMMFNDSDEVALKAMTDALAKLKSSSAAIKARNQIDELLSKLDRDPSSVTDVELKNLINQFPNQDFAQIKKLINAADAFAVKRDALKLKHLMDALPRDDIDMAETLRGLMLAQMPSRSIMKHMIRRKGMPGYSNDFARIVSAYNAKVNNQIPRLHNRKAVFEGKRTVETALRQAVQDNVLRPDLAREILNKVDNEVKTSMSPPDVSPVILALNRVGFRRYLATPGAALMQTSSVPLLSLPVLSGKYGFDASSSALKKAFDIYLAGSAKRRGKGDDWYMAGIGNGLDVVGLNPKTRQEYKDAWNEFTSSGLITHGEAQQALGGGRKPTYDAKGMGKYLNAADKLMGFTDKLFTEAESMPRQVTAMASYMLARKAGVSHAQAIKEATDLTYSALGDYSDIGRPAIFKGNLGRAVYQFQSYGQKFITQQAKLFKTAFMEGGVDPSLPKEQQKLLKARAARTLAGIWATHGVLAGAAGLPFAGLVGAALEALEDWMDPDEYHDMEQQIRSFVRNDIGLDEFMTRMFMNGLPGAMLDWNISPRIGAGDLLMRNDLDKKTAAENLKQFVFDTLGPAVAIFSDTFKAMDYLQEGETYRFYEQIMPHAWWRSVLAANRYAQEGIRTKEGAHILTPDQLEMADILTKAAGIEPLEVSETREQAYGLKKAELFINERKKSLYNRYFKAAMNHDQDKLAEVSAEIARFRSVHPDVPFDLERSMQSKLKRIQQAEESGIGLVLNEATLKNLTGRHEYEDLIMARQNR